MGYYNWLVVWLPSILFSQKYWEFRLSSLNWRAHIFQRGGEKPPTRGYYKNWQRKRIDVMLSIYLWCYVIQYHQYIQSFFIWMNYNDLKRPHWLNCHWNKILCVCRRGILHVRVAAGRWIQRSSHWIPWFPKILVLTLPFEIQYIDLVYYIMYICIYIQTDTFHYIIARIDIIHWYYINDIG